MTQASKADFRHIKQQIIARIKQQIWKPGNYIPKEVELCDEFNCARATINRALRELANEGYLERKRKSGTRVRTPNIRQVAVEIPLASMAITARGQRYRYQLLSKRQIPQPKRLMKIMGTSEAIPMIYLQCLHYANDKPFQLENRWINLIAVPQAEHIDFSDIEPSSWLIQEIPFTDADIKFAAQSASKTTAYYLDIKVGDPVFVIERTTWFADTPITHTELLHTKDFNLHNKS